MFTITVREKEYKIKFGYRQFCESDLLDNIIGMQNDSTSLQEMFSVLPELLLAGLQSKHYDEFGFETETEQKSALNKVYDLLDDYEDESTDENPKNGFDLLTSLVEELNKNGFLSKMAEQQQQIMVAQNATIVPQDHQKPSKKK